LTWNSRAVRSETTEYSGQEISEPGFTKVSQLIYRDPGLIMNPVRLKYHEMRPAKTFKMVPDVPARIGRLKNIAYNLWWSWNYECMELIRRVDRELWEAADHNPVKMLGMVSQVRAVPKNPLLGSGVSSGMVKWAG